MTSSRAVLVAGSQWRVRLASQSLIYRVVGSWINVMTGCTQQEVVESLNLTDLDMIIRGRTLRLCEIQPEMNRARQFARESHTRFESRDARDAPDKPKHGIREER